MKILKGFGRSTLEAKAVLTLREKSLVLGVWFVNGLCVNWNKHACSSSESEIVNLNNWYYS